MSEPIKIKIISTLDVNNSINDINSAIKGIEKKIDKLNLKVNIDTGQLSDVTKLIDNVQKQANSKKVNINIGSNSNFKDLNNATEKQLIETLKLNDVIKNQEVLVASIDRVSGKWSATVKENATQQRTLSGVIDKSTGDIYKQKEALSDATSRHLGFGKAIGIALERTLQWSTAMGLFYGSIHMFQSMTDEILKVDSAMTSLKRVFDATPEQYNSMLQESIALSKELGTNVHDVMSSLNEVARSYGDTMSQADMMNLTKTSMLAANISDLSSEDAMKSLIGTMNAYKIATSDSIQIVDKMNEVDNNFSVSTTQLSGAMSRAAGVSKQYGLSLDDLIGQTTAIASVTMESGEIIGRAQKAIYSRIMTLPQAQKALADVGISVKNATGEMRPLGDILDETASKWGKFSNEQKNMVSINVAGTDQLSRFVAMMSAYETGVSASETALNSQNSAMRENMKYQDSMEARLNKLKTKFTEMSLVFGEAIINDSLISAIDVLGKLATGASFVVDKVGLLPPVFGMVGVAVTLLSTKLKTFSTALIFGSVGMKTAALESIGLTAGMSRAAIATTGLSVAFKGLLASTGVGLLLVGVGFALEALVKKYSEAKQAQEDFEKAQQTNIDALTTNKDKTNELIASYRTLSREKESGGAWNSDKEKEYLQVQSQLAEVFPALVGHIDATGQAHLKSSEQIDKEVALTNKLIEAKKEELKVNAGDEIKKQLKEQLDLQDQIAKKKEELSYWNKMRPSVFGVSEEEKNKGIKKLETEIASLEMKTYNASQTINDQVLKISDAYTNLEIDPKIQKSVDSFVSSLDFSNIKNPERLEYFSKRLAELEDQLQTAYQTGNEVDFNKTIESINNLYQKMGNAQPYSKGLTLSLDDLKKAEENIVNSSYDADGSIADLGDTIDATTMSADNASDSLKNYTDSISYINGILEDYQDNNKLTASTILELIDKYPELIAYIGDEGRLIKELKTIRDNDVTMAKQQIAEKLATNEAFYNTNLKALQKYFDQHFSFYKGDLTQFKTLAQAKADVEGQLIQQLAKGWTMYYNTATQQFAVDNWAVGTPQADAAVKANQELTKFRDAWDNFSLDKIDLNLKSIGTSLDKNTNSTKKSKDATKDAAKETERYTYVSDAFQKRLDEINLALEKQRNIQSKYPEWSKQYQKALKEEIRLLEKKQGKIDAEAESLKKQIKSGYINKTGVLTTDEAARNTSYSKGTTGTYSTAINKYSKQYNVDAELVKAVAKQESQLGKYSKNVMQVTNDKMVKLAGSAAEKSINAGSKYLASMLKKAGGNIKEALAAYNMGEGILKFFDKHGGYSIKNMQSYSKMMNAKTPGKVYGDPHYVEKVMKNYMGTIVQTSAKVASSASKNVADYYLKNYKISTGYNVVDSTHPNGHKGIDLNKPGSSDLGDTIKAVMNGKVKTAGYSKTTGYWVEIIGEDGKVTSYMHMRKQPTVKVGQNVKAGQKIGEIGNTGRSFGAHLDFKVKDSKGNYEDPLAYLKNLSNEASKVVAEDQSSVDDAISELNSLLTEQMNDLEKISELNLALVQSYVAAYDHEITKLQNTIDSNQLTRQSLDPNSTAFEGSLKREVVLQKEIKKEIQSKIKFTEKQIKTNNNLTSSAKDALNTELQGYKKNLKEQELAVNESAKAIIENNIQGYDKVIGNLEKQADRITKARQYLDPTSQEYIDNLKEESKILDEIEKKNKEKLNTILKQVQLAYKNKEINKATYKELTDLINGDFTDAVDNSQNNIKDFNNETENLIVDQLTKQKEDHLDKIRKKYDEINESLKKLINTEKEFYNSKNEFTDNFDAIIYELDKIDEKYKKNPLFRTSTSGIRNSLSDFRDDINRITSDVERMINATSDSESGLQSLIEKQSNYANNLYDQIAEIDNKIRDTELLNKQTEDSLQNQIDLKREQLQQLDEQYNKEDRLKQLRDLEDQINKVKNDKRFSYIDQYGNEILTYDKGKLDELTKQKDEMLQQFQREDIKKAMEDEVARLEEKLAKTQEINAAEVASLQLQKDRISYLYDQIVSNVDTKMQQLQTIQEENIVKTEENWNGIIEAVQNGQLSFDELMNNWYGKTIEEISIFNENLNAQINQIKDSLASLSSLKVTTPSISGGSSSGGSGGGGGSSSSSGGSSYEDIAGVGRMSDTGTVMTKSGSYDNETGEYSVTDHRTGETTTGTADSYSDYEKVYDSFHDGGIVGKKPTSNNRLTEIVNKLFNVKPNEEVIKSLKGELQVPPKNIPNFFTNMSNLVNSITPQQSLVPVGDTIVLQNVTIKADNPKQFLSDLQLHIRMNK